MFPVLRKQAHKSAIGSYCVPNHAAIHASAAQLQSAVLAVAPLEGFRILDFSTGVAGSFCTMLLGDFGADIVKVEPVRGDTSRHFGLVVPAKSNDTQATTTLFLALNRNKRSIVLDEEAPGAEEKVKHLVKSADVVVTSSVPSELKKRGLDYASLKAINPKIIHCSITGYGATGPFAERASNDATLAGESGVMFCTGEKNRPPVRPQPNPLDSSAAYCAYGSIMAATISREQTGKGVFIDVAAMDAQLASFSNAGVSWLWNKIEYTREGTGNAIAVPYAAVQTKDSMIMLGIGTNNQFVKLLAAMGAPELFDDPRFASTGARVSNREVVMHAMENILTTQTTDYWMQQFNGKGFPVGRVNNVEDVFNHPQVGVRKLISRKEHPGLGVVYTVGPAVLYNGERMEVRLPAPRLGEHTDQIMREYSMTL